MTPRTRQSPLRLEPTDLDPESKRPLVRQLADLIRTEIVTGRLAAGDPLPSVRALAEHFGVGKNSIAIVYQRLADEGLLARRRQTMQVRAQPPTRILDSDRFVQEWERARRGIVDKDGTAFCRDYGCSFREYTVDTDYTYEPARDREAGLLRIPTGNQILRREFNEYARGVPVQLRTSLMVAGLVRNTPIADREHQPWPGGTVAEVASLGVRLVGISQSAIVRAALRHECEFLRLPEGHHVLVVTRRFAVEDRRGPVHIGEASVVVMPAADNCLQWVTNIP